MYKKLLHQVVLPISALVLLQACDSLSFSGSDSGKSVDEDTDPVNFSALNTEPTNFNVCSGDALTIVSASSEHDHDENFEPDNVFDGRLSSDSRWSTNGIGRAIVLDLGSSQTISSIKTAWYKADERQAYFDIETSQNSSTWTPVVSDGVASGTEGFVTNDIAETTARYVRIVGNGNSDSSWTSLIEVEILGCSDSQPVDIPPVDPPPVTSCSRYDNLLVTSASSDDDHGDDYGPRNVIDNNLDSDSRWSSYGSGNSVVLELDQLSTVRRVATAWYKADERQAFFDVRTSTDNSSWNTVLSQATATGTEGMLEFELADSAARYVEIRGLGNSASDWNSLIEVDIQGCGTVDPADEPPTPPAPTQPASPAPTPPAPTPPPTSDGGEINVVFNGTFENALSGWSQIEPAQGSSDTYEGIGSGKVFDSGSISQSLFLIPQSRYRVAAWLQGNPTLGIRVGGETFSVTGSEPSGSGEYKRVEFEFDSDGADTGEVFLRATSSSDSVRADNIEVVKISNNTNGSPPIDPNTVFDFGIWEVEGESPITREGTLRFDALDQCVVTPNGNGCRHEQKVITTERHGLTEQYEFFSATIEANLSRGSETIVVQHHPEATGTLSALYLSDREDARPGEENGIARDGIFDVVATVRKPGSTDNNYVVFGTVRSGEQFDYQVVNDHGVLTMTALGKTETITSADSSNSYLKFGNYVQARDPVTGDRMDLDKPLDSDDREPFLDYYDSKGITESVVIFRDILYQRTID